jgi:hypothetical protein
MGTELGSNLSGRGRCVDDFVVDDGRGSEEDDENCSSVCKKLISNSCVVFDDDDDDDDDDDVLSASLGMGSNSGGSTIVAFVVVAFPAATSMFLTIKTVINLDNEVSHLPSILLLSPSFFLVVIVVDSLPFSGSNIGSTKTSPASGLLSK